ncbi:hypothetical protein B0I72DRAFT_171152 [Yarrowia lipolytica]|jgi:hypothetical protein|nr:hypothetical protein B0I72DRAFT_171152 [Yarrowia lipolytica]RDW36287.1 hypothetical protein B0I73DRAFT_177732 [Yarrowia lipolytica]
MESAVYMAWTSHLIEEDKPLFRKTGQVRYCRTNMWNFIESDDGNYDNDEYHPINGTSNHDICGNYNTFSTDPSSFNFKPTFKLSDTLKFPSLSKCRSETNIRCGNSVGFGKSILKSKSETQLVSILKESTSRESEEDRYLSGGYSETLVAKEEVRFKRPTLKYTKSESKFGTYGFDSCRYISGDEDYSYRPERVATDSYKYSSFSPGGNGDKKKEAIRVPGSSSVSGASLGMRSTTSYTRSLDHFTLRVVKGGENDGVPRHKSLDSILEFPEEYNYDHFTLQDDHTLGENGTGNAIPSITNAVQSDMNGIEPPVEKQPIPRASLNGSTSSSKPGSSFSSAELSWSLPHIDRSEPPKPSNLASGSLLRSSSRPPPKPRRTSTHSFSLISNDPRPSAVSITNSRQTTAGGPKTPHHNTQSDKSRSVSKSNPPVNHYSHSNNQQTFSNEETHFNNPLTPQYTNPRQSTPPPSDVLSPREPQNSPPKADLLAAIAHIVPLVSVESCDKPAQHEATPPPANNTASPTHDNSPSAYQNSKSRAVANLRNRQLLQARGIRVLPPSPLRQVCHVRSDEEDLAGQTSAHPPARRASLFKTYTQPHEKPETSMESRDSVFKTQTETALFKSRDLLEKFRLRKPTTLTLAKNLVDEILLFSARYLLIKQEKLRKYALLHSAVTNCYLLNTGWIRDHKTRIFSKAEGPFIVNKRK